MALPSGITSMSGAFQGCTSFNQNIEIPSTVLDMSDCFNGCTSLTQNITIPAGVTDLENCFKNCSALTQVTLTMSSARVEAGSVTMTNCFSGCTALSRVNVPKMTDESDEWHSWRIKPDYPSTKMASVQCFNKDGSARFTQNNTPTDVTVTYGSSNELTLPIKSNMIAFGTGLDDTVAADVIANDKSVTSDDHALDPTAKNFVLWGADGTNFETNLPLGGGGSAGDGISISGGYISQTTDQLTFTGTQAQWEALTSAEKAKYGLVNITDDEEAGNYPLGFIYMQLYNPTSASWEKSPLQLGMKPASGCEWTEITGNFANYPYLKIGSGTNSHGHNAVHGHRIGIWNANNKNYPKRTWKDGNNNDPDGYYNITQGLRLYAGNAEWVMSASEYSAGRLDDPFGNMGGGGDIAGSTTRQGNVADNTWNELHNYPEPNNSSMKIWKVIASA